MSDVSVALATDAETPACLALLPDLHNLDAEFLIARQDGALAGAAGLVWRHRRTAAGFPLEVEVLPDRRRRGVGRALVAAALRLAQGEAPGLWSRRPLEAGSTAAAFAEACGFRERGREHHFIAEVAKVSAYVAPLVAKLKARGHIPARARIVALKDAPPVDAAWLISAEFGGGPGAALAVLAGRAGGGIDLERSRAVMDGDQLAGVVFGRGGDDMAIVEGSIVAPAWRKGWANALITDAVLAVARDGGFDRFRFHCGEEVLDTMRLAERAEAVLERTAAWYYAEAASS